MTSSGRSGPRSSWSDFELIQEIKKGDLGAFTALVERHQRSLLNFFFHNAWDRQTAEDCTQEVFLRLYSHLGSYEPQAKFTTFLYRVARNLWIDRMRAAASHPGPVSLETPAANGDEGVLRDRIRSREESPVEILEKRETHAALRTAIERLPEDQRMVLILSEMQGLKYKEIGEIMDVPVGTVKSRMHTAVERLKELMGDHEV
ncbi:MAG: sigma-70 family RNA polymerase sigma factor [Planctomycetes bacterium]|nr:sigma-70 family RNA polymerase sigma factor [Planctomycetota bacterium]